MRLAITGADGFIGQAVCEAIKDWDADVSVRLFDKSFAQRPLFPSVELDLCHPDAPSLVAADADCVIHLAAMPGAAAEKNPIGSARLNLHFPLVLIEEMRGKRLVYASSIAVFGDRFPADDPSNAAAEPNSVYGTQKRMVELAHADAVRRGALEGLAVRIPGVVARPEAAGGFGSSFLSEIFYNAFSSAQAEIPVSPSATSWLCSSKVCAHNLIHAAFSGQNLPSPLVMPAISAEIGELVNELGENGATATFNYRRDAELERRFASHPPIDNHAAIEAGFVSDGDLPGLVRNVLDSMEAPERAPSL